MCIFCFSFSVLMMIFRGDSDNLPFGYLKIMLLHLKLLFILLVGFPSDEGIGCFLGTVVDLLCIRPRSWSADDVHTLGFLPSVWHLVRAVKSMVDSVD